MSKLNTETLDIEEEDNCLVNVNVCNYDHHLKGVCNITVADVNIYTKVFLYLLVTQGDINTVDAPSTFLWSRTINNCIFSINANYIIML